MYTKDAGWTELRKTTYYVLNSLSKRFDGQEGKGLIPDWCSVDSADNFYPLEGKNSGFGWEAVRVPFRVILDFTWFGNDEAFKLMKLGLSKFIEEEWAKDKAVYCEYEYSGISDNKYENPAFYAAYYCALNIVNSDYAADMLSKTGSYLTRKSDRWFYGSEDEYYVNSLAWFAEGVYSGALKNFYKRP